MKRLIALGAVVVAAALPPAAMSGKSADRGTLTAHSSRFGQILFDGKGFVLYAFTKDPRGRSACYGACAAAWPPYLVRRTPRAGAGVKSKLLGTTKRKGGKLQVTYAGRPLYYYVGDRSPYEIRCQNVDEFGGLWLVARPSGTLVR
jgi:predicted lipoprotein with Yx(FWY)xxD motif